MAPIGIRFKALSDPTRRKILALLRTGDMAAGEIADRFDISKPSISHHLNLLKQADLVTHIRRGQQIVYSLNTSVVEEIIGWLLDFRQGKGDGDE